MNFSLPSFIFGAVISPIVIAALLLSICDLYTQGDRKKNGECPMCGALEGGQKRKDGEDEDEDEDEDE